MRWPLADRGDFGQSYLLDRCLGAPGTSAYETEQFLLFAFCFVQPFKTPSYGAQRSQEKRITFSKGMLPSSFPGGSVVKNLLSKQEMLVWSLGQEDPLQKEMVTHSSILAWEIPWTEEPGGLLSMGSQRVGRGLLTKQQHAPFHLHLQVHQL